MVDSTIHFKVVLCLSIPSYLSMPFDGLCKTSFYAMLSRHRLYVEQYRLIQTLCGGTDVTDITDIMDVTDMDIMDVTDIMRALKGWVQ